MATPSPEEVARYIAGVYYSFFDTERQKLEQLYGPDSELIFSGEITQGGANIVQKLVSLQLGAVEHEQGSIDALASHEPGGVIVMVTGKLLTLGQEYPLNFSQVFQLMPTGVAPHHYYIRKDIFRLV